MTDDILTRLRGWADRMTPTPLILDEAATEIERLRAALLLAAGKLSTLVPYTLWHPETIYKAFLEDGEKEASRG